MFASSAIGPKRTPAAKIEDLGIGLVSTALLSEVIRNAASPVITEQEIAVLRQADADGQRLEAVEETIRRDLYGSGSSGELSLYHRLQAEALQAASGETPGDVAKAPVRSREELTQELTLRKVATHRALIEAGSAIVRVCGSVVPRITAEAGRLADGIEDRELDEHVKWGVIPYVQSNLVRGLRQLEANAHRMVPVDGVPGPRLAAHPFLAALVSDSKPEKTKATR